MFKRHYEMFAAYNGWANKRLYGAVAKLGEEDWRRDVGAFFGSMRGTLNHILVADRIWMKRFTGEGDAPATLDSILHKGFDDLLAARIAEDERIGSWLATLEERDFSGTFSYVTVVNPVEVTQPLAPALAHFFNHQTHHRGQAHHMLSTFGHTPPSLDLIYFQRENPTYLDTFN